MTCRCGHDRDDHCWGAMARRWCAVCACTDHTPTPEEEETMAYAASPESWMFEGTDE